MSDDLLAIYLNDHRAALTAERQLAERIRSDGAGPALGEYLDDLFPRLDAADQLLQRALEQRQAAASLSKQAAAWLGVQLGQLKLNGRLFTRSPLSRLVEIEGLIAAAHLRHSLWQALDILPQKPPAVEGTDIKALAHQAHHDADRLAAVHQQAAVTALSQSATAR